MWVQLHFGTWARLAVLFRGWKRYQTRAKRWQVRGGRRRNSSSTASVTRLKYPPFAFCLSPAPTVDPGSLPPTSATPLSVSSPQSVQLQPRQGELCFLALNLSAAGNAFRKQEVLAERGDPQVLLQLLWEPSAGFSFASQKNLKLLPEFHRLTSSCRCSSEVD